MNSNDLKIAQISIDEIRLSEYNPRKHSEEQADQLKESIKRFGMVEPVICNSNPGRYNVLIGGHFRLVIAKKLGYDKVPVIYINIADINKEKELNIRLNKNTGEWDLDILKSFETEMLLDIGFSDHDLSTIWDEQIEIENDDEFNVNKEIINARKTNIKDGQIFQLGKHFLICGDSTKENTIKLLMGKNRADIILTDPPYNINLDYNKGLGGVASYGGDVKDNKTDMEYKKFLLDILGNALKYTKDNAHVFCFSDQHYIGLVQEIYKNLGISSKRVCLWIKGQANPTPRIAFNKSFEPCIYGTKGKPFLSSIKNFTEIINKEVDAGNRSIDDILDILDIWLEKRVPFSEYEHPTQKPLDLCEKPLKRCTKPGDNVLDVCAGSGWTLLACQQLNRHCFSAEINPVFCQLIINRYENKYGKVKSIN